MTGEENSGRVTTKQYYAELLEQTKEMGQIKIEMGRMELRIVEKINEGITSQQEYQQGVETRLAAGAVHFNHLEDDVDKLEKWDKRIGILSVISSFIAGIIGIDRIR